MTAFVLLNKSLCYCVACVNPVDINFEGLGVGTLVSDEEERGHLLFDNEAWMGSVFDPKYLQQVIVQRNGSSSNRK